MLILAAGQSYKDWDTLLLGVCVEKGRIYRGRLKEVHLEADVMRV